MIVRDFLDWVRTAPASKRAEATSALARAYLSTRIFLPTISTPPKARC